MQSNFELDQLRTVVSNESLPLTERKDAAAHAVRLMIAAITEPANDDPEVVKLMQPWPRETELDRQIADLFARTSDGRGTNGYTLADAKATVLKRRKRLLIVALAESETENPLVRDAARIFLEYPSAVRWA